jgi:hypothetical protein
MRAARKHGQPEQCGEERHRQEKPRTITWAPGRGGSWDAYWWYNSQSQPKFMWPAAFPVVRSYLDQLVRGKGLSSLGDATPRPRAPARNPRGVCRRGRP